MGRMVCLLFAFSLLLSSPARADGLDGDVAFSKGNYASALRIWRNSAGSGHASAMLAIGTLYDTGHGVPQDFVAALSWYRRAAEAGNVRAMFNVGEMYDNGRGTSASRMGAIKWYGLAAKRGNGRAAYNLGVIYRDGDGIPRDNPAAIRFFRLAAEHGIAAARPNLIALGASASPQLAATVQAPRAAASGNSLVAAFGRFQHAALAREPVDPVALKVFKAMLPILVEKAEQGDGLAEYDLGFAYEHGTGVPRDLVKSYLHYLRAASALDSDVQGPALDGATAIERQLTDDEHGDARQSMSEGAR